MLILYLSICIASLAIKIFLTHWTFIKMFDWIHMVAQANLHFCSLFYVFKSIKWFWNRFTSILCRLIALYSWALMLHHIGFKGSPFTLHSIGRGFIYAFLVVWQEESCFTSRIAEASQSYFKVLLYVYIWSNVAFIVGVYVAACWHRLKICVSWRFPFYVLSFVVTSVGVLVVAVKRWATICF